MNRRQALQTLFGASVFDWERLLWVPGQKLISIPARRMVPFTSVFDIPLSCRLDEALKQVSDWAQYGKCYLPQGPSVALELNTSSVTTRMMLHREIVEGFTCCDTLRRDVAHKKSPLSRR